MTQEEMNEIMDGSNFFIDSSNPYDMKILDALNKQVKLKEWIAQYNTTITDGQLHLFEMGAVVDVLHEFEVE